MLFFVIRNHVLRIAVGMGTLSSLFLISLTDDGTNFRGEMAPIARTMAELLTALMELSVSLAIDLHSACCKKIDLNCRKYPVERCMASINIDSNITC